MAARVGSLFVDLKANTSGFRRGMSSAQKRVKGFSTAVGSARKILAGFGVGLGAISTGALMHSLKQTLNHIDATTKFARQLDVSTEALVRLRHAAKLSGVETSQLDAAMQTLAKRLGEGARRGTGPAVEALRDLGLNIDDIAQMHPDKALYAIADAMQRMEDPIKRNAIAANLFSKANQQMVLLLMQGEAGIKALGARAGDTFDDKLGASAERANDALTDLFSLIEGIKIMVLSISAGPLERLAAAAAEVRRQGPGFFENFAELVNYRIKQATGLGPGGKVNIQIGEPGAVEARLKADREAYRQQRAAGRLRMEQYLNQAVRRRELVGGAMTSVADFMRGIPQGLSQSLRGLQTFANRMGTDLMAMNTRAQLAGVTSQRQAIMGTLQGFGAGRMFPEAVQGAEARLAARRNEKDQNTVEQLLKRAEALEKRQETLLDQIERNTNPDNDPFVQSVYNF